MSKHANALLQPWTGPYGGVPPFDRVRVGEFEPTLAAAMVENLAEVERIAGNAAAADFDNTLVALEDAGRTLERVRAIYDVWASCRSTDEFQAVEREMAPRLAAFADQITQNRTLFDRIESVYESRETAGLSPEQQRLTWLYYTNFVRSGAKLEPSAKRRLSQINERLAALFTAFNQQILADETKHYLVLETEADLAGLPDSLRAAAAAAAHAKGVDGRWVITNTRSSMEPFLTSSDRRDLRERGWRMWVGRGDNGDENDTKPLITEILVLRAERARLLGYSTHAHWRLENTMARTPERALELLEAVWPRAVGRVHAEVAEMEAFARADGEDVSIAPWDYRYYAEKVRRARYDLDQNTLKSYLQLGLLRDAMFWVGGEIFGFAFEPVQDVPVYHPDVSVWRVTQRASGRHVGLFYFDPYARPAKRSGAWMSAYRAQERFAGEMTTLVSNNSNFVPGRPGEPVLISWDDATTLFHEFGHALHGLASAVAYPSLSGTAVPRDYVEFPSQLLEHWLSTPEVLQRFAMHHATRTAMPSSLIERIVSAAQFNQGFATTEYLASAFVDMKLHLAGGEAIDPAVFERDALAALRMPAELVMRHRVPHFQHIFAGDHYSAGYYSYLWADVLAADGFGAFVEADGPYDHSVAQRLREHVFAAGNTLDPAIGYVRFRGRAAAVDALLRKRGLLEVSAGGSAVMRS